MHVELARRSAETAEEIGLDVEMGRLLAVDWVHGAGRPPLVAYLYDGGVLGEDGLKGIRLQEEELLSWRLVGGEEITGHPPGALGRPVLAALDVLADGGGTPRGFASTARSASSRSASRAAVRWPRVMWSRTTSSMAS